MITPRPGGERGHARHGWLDTSHSFSFGDYHDPHHMQFSVLRVINEDRVAPSSGFGPHPHRDMEIVTIVLSGRLAHEDSLGNRSVIRPGEVQRMTAGTGVVHSEVNPSATEPTHLLQIWIQPDNHGHVPGYEQRAFDPGDRAHRFQLVASPDGREGSLTLHQDAFLYLARLDAGTELRHMLPERRVAYLQVASGAVDLDGHHLVAGDGAKIEGEPEIRLRGLEPAEVLLFDLP